MTLVFYLGFISGMCFVLLLQIIHVFNKLDKALPPKGTFDKLERLATQDGAKKAKAIWGETRTP